MSEQNEEAESPTQGSYFQTFSTILFGENISRFDSTPVSYRLPSDSPEQIGA